jgi:hypothetical protein
MAHASNAAIEASVSLLRHLSAIGIRSQATAANAMT